MPGRHRLPARAEPDAAGPGNRHPSLDGLTDYFLIIQPPWALRRSCAGRIFIHGNEEKGTAPDGAGGRPAAQAYPHSGAEPARRQQTENRRCSGYGHTGELPLTCGLLFLRRPRGGIGRRKRLKIARPYGHAGSTPAGATIASITR